MLPKDRLFLKFMAAIDKRAEEAGAGKAFGGGNMKEILSKHDNCCQVAEKMVEKIDLKSSGHSES